MSILFLKKAFNCGSIEFESVAEPDKEDLNFLFKSFDCTRLMQDSCVQKKPSSKLVLTAETKEQAQMIRFSASDSSQFSNECGAKIIDLYDNQNRDFFRIKEIIESYKLKVGTWTLLRFQHFILVNFFVFSWSRNWILLIGTSARANLITMIYTSNRIWQGWKLRFHLNYDFNFS